MRFKKSQQVFVRQFNEKFRKERNQKLYNSNLKKKKLTNYVSIESGELVTIIGLESYKNIIYKNRSI